MQISLVTEVCFKLWIMPLCTCVCSWGEAGAFSPVACFAQVGGWGARKCSSIVVGHRALNQLVVEAVAFFKLSAIHYLAHCNLSCKWFASVAW